MAWNPTYNVIDVGRIGTNLLAFFEENQEEALTWANGGEILSPFVKFYSSASGRLATQFPLLMILSKEVAQDSGGDAIEAVMSLTFEGMIQGGKPDDLVSIAPAYVRAVESMIANIPAEDFRAGLASYTIPQLLTLATEFDVLASSGAGGAYLQTFRTRVQFKLTVSGYN